MELLSRPYKKTDDACREHETIRLNSLGKNNYQEMSSDEGFDHVVLVYPTFHLASAVPGTLDVSD